jgi:hypothetical protein
MKNKKLSLLSIVLMAMTFVHAQQSETKINKKFKIVTIKSFLVSKPVPDMITPKGESEEVYVYNKDYLKAIGGENSPSIVEGKEFEMPDGEKNSFKLHTWKEDYLDLTKLYGKLSDVFVYMYAEIESDYEGEAYLHAGSNDGAKVWINGVKVIDHVTKNGRAAEKSQDIVKIELQKGKNTILLKVDQLGGGWGAYVQIYSKKEHEKYTNREKLMIEKSQKVAEIFETKVICKEADRYIGWPSITKTSDGELLVVFSGDRDGHVCPWGVDQMIRSKDNGKTWTEPETINNTPLDDRDAGIIQTHEGTLVLSWFTSMAFDNTASYASHPDWKRHRGKLSDETVERWLGNWTRRSTDGGKTWDEPVRTLGTAPHGPIVLKDGRLIYVGVANIDGEKKLSVEESKDDGRSWQLLSTIEIPENEKVGPYSEPHVVETLDGKLIAMYRYNPSDKSQAFLRQSESTDGGKTWTVTHPTKIWGFPPHLLRLKDGKLLVVYSVRKLPYSERACISKDNGRTWDVKNEIILSLSPVGGGDMGYPASVQLGDGSIITIYYQVDKKGEKPSLMMTHWRLK